jgi:hypothetical protein
MDVSKLLECHPELARDLLTKYAVRSFDIQDDKKKYTCQKWF